MKKLLAIACSCILFTSAPVYAGRTNGPGFVEREIKANSSHNFYDSFVADNEAHVWVISEGGPVQCFLLDKDAIVQDSQTTQHGDCDFTWTPKSNNRYNILIKNPNDKVVKIKLFTN